jgi:hypothetical protein
MSDVNGCVIYTHLYRPMFFILLLIAVKSQGDQESF